MSIESMRNIILLYFSFELKLDYLIEMVCFGRIALFDYNFYNEFAFEDFVVYNRNIHNFDLNITKDTSSLLMKSTAGVILSARLLINS